MPRKPAAPKPRAPRKPKAPKAAVSHGPHGPDCTCPDVMAELFTDGLSVLEALVRFQDRHRKDFDASVMKAGDLSAGAVGYLYLAAALFERGAEGQDSKGGVPGDDEHTCQFGRLAMLAYYAFHNNTVVPHREVKVGAAVTKPSQQPVLPPGTILN